MTLIRELIDIPTQVQDGDFVLKLTQGIAGDTKPTVDQYVVTDQLAKSFDEALGLVASAVSDDASKAAYLQGSFGSGKSHFMAMLHLLLSGDTHARSKPELHGAISKYSAGLDGKRFLLVPTHFLDAKSMEQRILGGYVERVAETDPDGGIPAVYLGDEIMQTELPNQRDLVGEDKFLAALNANVGGGDDWGEYGTTWTTASVDEALAAPATDEQRLELVKAYIATFRGATKLEAGSTGEGFVDLDRGLGAISRHAKTLGYDGIVLFLDELILWLAANIGDLKFVQEQSQKLTKLVEASHANRPVPIISFVARQRDLRDLVGNHIAGSELQSLADNLELQQGRFSEIKLASGNLPVVAKKRLLTPVDDGAGRQLADAVDTVLAGRDEVKRQLLGNDADIEMFRTVYPFSPALVQALVDVSEALQRERTALKVMLQLLVDQRDDLELGELIPVGDLWDVVASRDEPFSNELKGLFETAKKLWRTKLHPRLREVHGINDATPDDAPAMVAFRADSRILKTLLLAALVPEVEAFRGMTTSKLVALNWGSITSPIKGQEASLLATRLKRLQLGELTIGDDPTNPSVTLKLADVDTDEILARAVNDFDNRGARRQRVRKLITDALEGRIGDDLSGTFDYEWRGGVRPVDVVFGNIRDDGEISDSALVASPDRPKLIIDFPFDEMGRSPEDDLERLDSWSQAHQPSTTICWLPSFLNTDGLHALGRFVALEELLKADRFDQYTSRLSVNEKAQARPLLEGMRKQLAEQLSEAVLVAYGVVGKSHHLVDSVQSLTDHYRSLDPSVPIRPTTKPSFPGALSELCDQVFKALYPGHPEFEAKITLGNRRTVWDEIQRALTEDPPRVNVESSNRKPLRNIVAPLQLGTMSDAAFTLGDYWRTQLDRNLAAAGEVVTVEEVRRWIDEVGGARRGLDATVADLVVLTVAAQTQHRLTHRGAPLEIDLARPLPGDATLVPEQLPEEADWLAAIDRASKLFGLTFSKRVTGPELAAIGSRVRERAQAVRTDAGRLAATLQKAYDTWGLSSGARLETAAASLQLVESLSAADDADLVKILAGYQAPTSDEATAKSLSTAAAVAAAVERENLALWATARDVVGADVDELLASDQVVLVFEAEAQKIERRATDYVTARAPQKKEAAEGPSAFGARASDAPISATGTMANSRTVSSSADLDAVVAELRSLLDDGKTVTVRWETDPS